MKVNNAEGNRCKDSNVPWYCPASYYRKWKSGETEKVNLTPPDSRDPQAPHAREPKAVEPGIDIPHVLRRTMGLVINICAAQTQQQVILQLSTFVMASGSSQAWTDILSYLNDHLLDTYVADPESPMVVLPDWLQALKNYQMNWKDLANGKTKAKIEQLLGILVAFNLCEAADVSFDIGRFKMFRPTDIRSLDVFTVMDLLFETGVYFIEVGYCSWAMREPRILFLGVSGYDVDIEFAQLKEYWKYYELGNLKDKIKITEAVYFQRLNALHNNLSAAMYQATHASEKSLIAARRSFVGGLLCSFNQKRLGGAPKVRPFMLNLYGESSVGKSPMMDVIIQSLLASRGLPTDPSNTYTRDSGVKFWDGCRSDTLAVKLDDPTFSKNMKENYLADDMRIICNNQATAVNMSAVEDKGKVTPCFQIAVTSTNAKNLRASEIAFCPWAFQRRNDYVITVAVRPEFRAPGSEELDRTKVATHYGDKEPPLIEDLWLITVEKPTKPSRAGYNCEYENVMFRGKYLEKISLELAIQFLIEQYNSHMDHQEELVERMTRRSKAIKKCGVDGCRQIRGHCAQHLNSEEDVINEDYTSDDEGQESSKPSEKNSNPPGRRPVRVETVFEDDDESAYEDCAEPEFGIVDAAAWAMKKSVTGIISKAESSDRRVALLLITQFEYFYRTYDYLNLLPSWVCKLPGFAEVMACIDTWGFSKTYCVELYKILILETVIFGLVYYFLNIWWAIAVAIPIGLYRLKYYTEKAMAVYRQDLIHRNRTMTVVHLRTRDYCANLAIHASAAIATMYVIFKSRRMFKEAAAAWTDLFKGDETTVGSQSTTSSSSADTFVDAVPKSLYLDQRQGPPVRYQIDVGKEAPSIKDKQSIIPIPEDVDCTDESCNSSLDSPEPRKPLPSPSMPRLAEAHGSFEPEMVAEILARDNAYNDWGDVVVRPVPCPTVSKTMTKADFMRRVGRHLMYVQLVTPTGEKLMAQVLHIATGFAILPYHYFQMHDSFEVTGFRDDPDKAGGRIATRMSRQRAVRIPGSDLCVCCIDSGGPVAGVLDMFADGDVPDCVFHLMRRSKRGTLGVVAGRGTVGLGTHTLMQNFNALRYDYLEYDSAPGWCGSPLISDGKFPAIVGLHVAGNDPKHKGYACTITRQQVRAAIEELRSVPGTLRMGNVDSEPNMGEMEYTPELPHKKSPLRYQRAEAQFAYHGNTGKRVRPSHSVISTPIAKTVSEVFDIEDTTRPPGIHPEWKGLQQTLRAAANPGLPHKHDLMQAAAEDYASAGRKVFQKDLFKDTKPLTKEETINGIEGVKFVDPINTKSSAHPWKGSKADHMEGIPGARTLDPEIEKQWNEAKEWLRQGKRLGLASKSCLKSEVHWKDKSRYFYVSHMVLTLLVREYFLPLIRVMQLNPFIFECAVGLNAHGPDWDALHEHIHKYGIERLLAGDYKEYDTRVPAQGLQYAFWCLLEFARCCVYNEDDLLIMEALAGEIIYPTVDLNGDLVTFTEGTHVSGNSLTVILNGIVGSLNMRCFFFQLYPGVDFRSVVSLITYGDDNAGSVKEGFERFNIKSFAHYLAGLGQIYTMPDKEQELQEYLDPKDFEFLKRKSVYHEKLGCRIGALSEKSMLKSLLAHNYDKKNPLSEMEVTCQAMESFAIECFNHGKDFHEDYMTKLRTVALSHGIAHHVRNLDLNYEQGVEVWKQKYYPEDAESTSADSAKSGSIRVDTE